MKEQILNTQKEMYFSKNKASWLGLGQDDELKKTFSENLLRLLFGETSQASFFDSNRPEKDWKNVTKAFKQYGVRLVCVCEEKTIEFCCGWNYGKRFWVAKCLARFKKWKGSHWFCHSFEAKSFPVSLSSDSLALRWIKRKTKLVENFQNLLTNFTTKPQEVLAHAVFKPPLPSLRRLSILRTLRLLFILP